MNRQPGTIPIPLFMAPVFMARVFMARVFIVWALMVLAVPVQAYRLDQGPAPIRLPDMGASSEVTLSSADERRLGEAFMRAVRARIKIIDEPGIDAYLNDIGYRLVSHSERNAGPEQGHGTPGKNYKFFVIEDPAINAFAVPGGFIGVNAGLILTTESESDLAAVLAHEIAHVTQHHVARSMHLAENMHPLAMAGILAAMIIGGYSGEAGRATMAAVTAGSVQKQIDFTRAHEAEADRVGIRTLFAAGFDPRAMPNFFERMQSAHRYYSEPPEFLSTHPVTVSRIADSRNRAEQYPYRQYADSLEYHLVRAHLTVMMKKEPGEAREYFEDALEEGKYRDRAGARYGLALATLAAGDRRRARAEIGKLLKEKPDYVTFRARLAEIELADGHVGKAVRAYGDALALYPGNRLLTLGYARALLEAGRPEKVVALLDRREAGPSSKDPALFRLLARAFARLGRDVEAESALAEHYYLEGDLDGAIRQLRMALKKSEQDYYQASRIEARLREFEEEWNLRER